MGDEILKTLYKIMFLVLFSTLLLNAKESLSLGNEVKAYDQIFGKIAEKRLGVEAKEIERIENPFVIQYEGMNSSDGNQSEARQVLVLEATLEQKAKINGIWYKKNERVNSYTLTNIDHNRVILRNESEKKELYIRTKDDSNFKISFK